MSNDLGLPDIGLTSLDQVSYRSSQIARVTDLPTIVDIDTGFGNCKKTIEVFEAKGLAGCHLEDQVAEKRCGHLDNKELVSIKEMVKNIEECVKSKAIVLPFGETSTLMRVPSEVSKDSEVSF